MKFRISSAILSNVLQNTSKAMSPKQTMPILGYFLFVLKDDKLTITASDLDSTMIAEIEVENLGNSGRIAVPSITFMDVIRELGDQPIVIDIDEDNFEIKMVWSTGDIILTGLNGFGYPEIENENSQEIKNITFKSAELNAGINKTHFATSNSTTRPVLTGILMDITTDYAVFVATDAHQLVKLAVNKQIEVDEPTSLILPKKTALLLRGILAKDDEEVQVCIGENNVKFITTNYSYISRKIEGKYPNYNAAIPLNSPSKLAVNRVQLLNSLKRVSVCSKNSNNLVTLNISNDNIYLVAKDFDYSTSANDNVACVFEGNEEKVEINLKAQNIIDMLSVLVAEEITIEFTDNTRPVLISAADSEDEYEKNTMMMLMPVSI